MKVLHLSGATSWRGGEQQLLYLHDSLKSQNIEQIILCPFNSELYNRMINKEEEKIIGYNKSISIDLNFALKLKKYAGNIKLILFMFTMRMPILMRFCLPFYMVIKHQ